MWQGYSYLKSSGLFYFLPGICTHNKWLYPEFQFTATNFMSMAAKLSDLVDETSGAKVQMEGHADMPSQSAKDPWELEALDSSPSHSPSWSPTCRMPSSHPNAKYCLEICMTLMEELGGNIPTSHSWMAPLWKICCAVLELDSPKQLWHARVGQFFSMRDIQWGRAWLQMRLEMLHSYSQEQVHGLENWPTSLQTQWQSRG